MRHLVLVAGNIEHGATDCAEDTAAEARYWLPLRKGAPAATSGRFVEIRWVAAGLLPATLLIYCRRSNLRIHYGNPLFVILDYTNHEGTMTFTDSIRICFKKYADFKGCASRPEFWWWFLFTLIASLALDVIDKRLANAFSIITFVPSIAVGARRLHDTNRSGWLQLLCLLPIIGWILLIVWLAQERKLPNRYCDEGQDGALST